MGNENDKMLFCHILGVYHYWYQIISLYFISPDIPLRLAPTVRIFSSILQRGGKREKEIETERVREVERKRDRDRESEKGRERERKRDRDRDN